MVKKLETVSIAFFQVVALGSCSNKDLESRLRLKANVTDLYHVAKFSLLFVVYCSLLLRRNW